MTNEFRLILSSIVPWALDTSMKQLQRHAKLCRIKRHTIKTYNTIYLSKMSCNSKAKLV